ncbi:hypothetical protein [Azospirillum rugosum]|uniref:Methyl-accepting transducer domain-containing protein n=1 Tax=Azospirillum rugosum TaxID=416170 RepID=A0ABS4SJV0_9PROT|nr:hypothetical protein [Azospirillum rugosum]MBP2292358.1 hypothetical protein [Azospirillum rugosum]MDQ0526117.1 hypothetical protein [Azospirillum rugosum]
MATTTNADGTADASDLIGRLTEMSDRTNLMVIDATLRALPDAGPGFGTSPAQSAAEVRALARRMLQATLDFQAVICEPAE